LIHSTRRTQAADIARQNAPQIDSPPRHAEGMRSKQEMFYIIRFVKY
jgi:hypothetical protein